jgi:hypothetical protein
MLTGMKRQVSGFTNYFILFSKTLFLFQEISSSFLFLILLLPGSYKLLKTFGFDTKFYLKWLM